MTDSSPAQRYGPTSGTAVGVLGVVACAGIVVVALVDSATLGSVRVAIAAAVLGVLAWAFMLRPRIIVEEGGHTLVLRNPLSTWRVPLVSVRVVAVRVFTTIRTEDEVSFQAVAVGYSARRVARGAPSGLNRQAASTYGTLRAPMPPAPEAERSSSRPTDADEQTIMTDRVLAAADRARALGHPGGPAQRSFAVAEIALLVGLGIAFVVTLFL